MQLLHLQSGGRLSDAPQHPRAGASGADRRQRLRGESWHRFSIREASAQWRVLAAAADGSIEAFVHRQRLWLGLMWQPEREQGLPKPAVGGSMGCFPIARCCRHEPAGRPRLGDSVRTTLDGHAQAEQHDLAARRRRAWRLAQMANTAAGLTTPVIVATISLFHDVQQWNRRHNPRYAELLLEVPWDELCRRRPELYLPAASTQPVVGVDLPAELPLAPELRLSGCDGAASLQAQLEAAYGLWQRLTEQGRPACSG
jgi:cytidine diphosphoramidate kinase